ncbi:MAG: NTP transferase domain-containing protein [Coriobacteriales bacterium]|nr:NTP transferase domain-containing protein [Coriobacteriales bacterium]
MNKPALLCRAIASGRFTSQRQLAQELDISIGSVNTLIRQTVEQGLIQQEYGSYVLTADGRAWLEQFKVDNAIILAAGLGTRFAPFTYDTPKGLLKVNGTPMIHRQIEQLLEAGIREIVIVVGYLAEMFEYLVDRYGVTLVYNPEYAIKNNLASLHAARAYLGNSYVLVADNWIEQSVFYPYEPDSWVSCLYFEDETVDWGVTTGPHDLITRIEFGARDDWAMVGPAHFTSEFSARYRPLLEEYYARPGTGDYYWEHIIKENIGSLPLHIKRQNRTNLYEFENFEDLRGYDPSYLGETDNEVLGIIAQVFDIPQSEIVGISPMSEGMTNRSFVFEVAGERYVYRQPGAGTERLVNRNTEKRSYELMAPLDLTDEILYFDGESGVKITRFYNATVGDAEDEASVRAMMGILRSIHDADIKTDYRFDIGERIAYYEKLANERHSILFEDYAKVRAWADELLSFRDALAIPERLCHIDFIYANVLFLQEGGVRVIDWEYSGMADPIIDVAMFSLYSYYSREQMDAALRYYLGRQPTRNEEARLYLYVALAGFLWSIWTEYKQGLGDEFGDYGIRMYRYMKDYYHLLKDGGYLDEPERGTAEHKAQQSAGDRMQERREAS